MPQNRSMLDRLYDAVAGPLPSEPSRPTPPGIPAEAYDDMKVNYLKVREVANIVANENRDVLPLIGKTTGEDLQRARVAQAHAIINADRTYGPDRMTSIQTAPSEVTGVLANSPQYERALEAARTAFHQQESGEDPLKGRMYFNNRHNDYTGPRHLGNEQIGIHERYGPFQYRNGVVYTIINDNPKNMPPVRRQR